MIRFSLPSRRVTLPKDEVAEEEERRHAHRLNEIARLHLEWAHERTQEAHEAGYAETADSYSMSTLAWLDRLRDLS